MKRDVRTDAPPPVLEPLEAEVQRLIDATGDSYVDGVVAVYEATEQTYRAAVMAGRVIHGFSDSTNF